MARRRRFKGLEATLKNLQDATTGTFDPTTLPANSVVSNYLKFKTGETKIDITRTPESLPGNLIEKTVIPFSRALADGGIVVLCSLRAFESLNLTGVTATNLNISDPTTDESPLRGFIPAKAILFKEDATQVDTKVDSQITGRKYNPREGASYTLPFGQKDAGIGADLTYAGVAAGIRASVNVETNVSFEPEYFPA